MDLLALWAAAEVQMEQISEEDILVYVEALVGVGDVSEGLVGLGRSAH